LIPNNPPQGPVSGEWNPSAETMNQPGLPQRPARRPISAPQALKLRDVDIVVLEDRCKGCSFCIEFCPRDVLEQGTKLNVRGVHAPRVKESALCVGCGVCEEICPDFAIFLVEKGKRR
jgi:2-oxoglutarate ferredoxin oxidoreductase subunit delta